LNYKSLVGGFNPSEKYESQLGLLFPIYGKIMKNKTCSKSPTRIHINPRLMLAITMWLYPPEGADGIAATSARRSGPWSGDGEIWS